MLFSYSTGAEAKQSIAKVLAALKNRPLLLITYCWPDRMPDDSFALISEQKPRSVVAQQNA